MEMGDSEQINPNHVGLQSPINTFGRPCISAGNSPSLKAFWENLSPLPTNNHSSSPHTNLDSARLLFTNFEDGAYMQPAVKDEVEIESLLHETDEIPRSPDLKRKMFSFKHVTDAQANKRKKEMKPEVVFTLMNTEKTVVETPCESLNGQQRQQSSSFCNNGEVCTAIEKKNMQANAKNKSKVSKKRSHAAAYADPSAEVSKGSKKPAAYVDPSAGGANMLQTPPAVPHSTSPSSTKSGPFALIPAFVHTFCVSFLFHARFQNEPSSSCLIYATHARQIQVSHTKHYDW
jgi:hypothetical protein